MATNCHEKDIFLLVEKRNGMRLGFVASSSATLVEYRMKQYESKKNCNVIKRRRILFHNGRVALGTLFSRKKDALSLRCCSTPDSDTYRVAAQTQESHSFIWSSAVSVKTDLTEALADVIARAIVSIYSNHPIAMFLIYLHNLLLLVQVSQRKNR